MGINGHSFAHLFRNGFGSCVLVTALSISKWPSFVCLYNIISYIYTHKYIYGIQTFNNDLYIGIVGNYKKIYCMGRMLPIFHSSTAFLRDFWK